MGPSNVMAYTWAFIVLVVFFLLAMLISFSITIKPDQSDRTPRKVWFWVLCVLTPVVAFILNLILSSGEAMQSAKDSYLVQSAIASAVVLVLYILVGFAISKSNPRSKIGSWFN